MKQFTKQEVEYLQENYDKQTIQQLALFLGRTSKSIKAKAFKLRIVNDRKSYNTQELNYLIENYATTSNPQLATILNRTKNSITRKAFDLGLRKGKEYKQPVNLNNDSKRNNIKINDSFGNLTVLENSRGIEFKPQDRFNIKCKCELCGTIKEYNVYILLKGASKSCGCNKYAAAKQTKIQNGTNISFKKRTKTTLGSTRGCWTIIEEPKVCEKSLKVRCGFCGAEKYTLIQIQEQLNKFLENPQRKFTKLKLS